MTKQELQEILNTIHGTYNDFLMGRDLTLVAKAWYKALETYEYEKINYNLQEWVRTKSKAPTISDLLTSKKKQPIPKIEDLLPEGYDYLPEDVKKDTYEHYQQVIRKGIEDGIYE